MRGSALICFVALCLVRFERSTATALPQESQRDDYVVIFKRSTQTQRDEHHGWLKREIPSASHQNSGVKNHIYFDDEFSGYHGKFTKEEADQIANSEHVDYVHKNVKGEPRAVFPDIHNDYSQEEQEEAANSLFDDGLAKSDQFSPFVKPGKRFSANKFMQLSGLEKLYSSLSFDKSSQSVVEALQSHEEEDNEPPSEHSCLRDPSLAGEREILKNVSWGLGMISHKERTESTDYAYKNALHCNVMIYVLDTGVFGEHKEFAGRQLRFNTDHSKINIAERYHATAVASLAAGNRLGVAKNAELVSVHYDLNIPLAVHLNWIADDFQKPENEGKKAVINLSFKMESSGSAKTAVEKVQALGIPVVIALANEEISECDYLKFIDNDLTVMVGSVDRNYSRTLPSAFGECVDVFAPGNYLEVAMPPIKAESPEYVLGRGTSFATPHVVGTIAYLWGQNISLDAREVIMKATRSNPGRLTARLDGSPNNLVYNGMD